MQTTRLAISEFLLLEPRVCDDECGFFYDAYSQKLFDEALGQPVTFVQDNHSRSVKGALRGLHYQLPPHAQGKLVRVTVGEIIDVAMDIRKGSPTFGQWVGETLSADNRRQLWNPPGFVHGFLVTTEEAEFQYKCTEFYAPEYEQAMHWADKAIAIAWPLEVGVEPIIYQKDGQTVSFSQTEKYGQEGARS